MDCYGAVHPHAPVVPFWSWVCIRHGVWVHEDRAWQQHRLRPQVEVLAVVIPPLHIVARHILRGDSPQLHMHVMPRHAGHMRLVDQWNVWVVYVHKVLVQ